MMQPNGVPDTRQASAPGTATGLFGRDSVTRRLHREPLIALAGLRALLLEALHPATMAALEDHSVYCADPWARLTRMDAYLRLISFGTAHDALRACARVRAVHTQVRGTTRDGVEYAADDPQLLAWVHCCQVASVLEITTRSGLRLTGAEQDAYIAEQVSAAMLVGLEPHEVPQDRAGIKDYFATIKHVLDCSPAARRAALGVLNTPPRRRTMSLVTSDGAPPPETVDQFDSWRVHAGLAFAALPPWARRVYALADLPGVSAMASLAEEATTRQLTALRTTLLAARL